MEDEPEPRRKALAQTLMMEYRGAYERIPN